MLGKIGLGCCCDGECETVLDEPFEYTDGSDIGPNFDIVDGTWEILTETLRTSTGGLVIAATEADSPNLRIRASAVNGRPPGAPGYRLILNYVDEDNYYFAEFAPSDSCQTDEQTTGWISLFTRSGGTDTPLGQRFHCKGGTGTIEACLNGTTFSAWDQSGFIADSSIEATVTAGTSGYYGFAILGGAGFTQRIIVEEASDPECEPCEGGEPNGTLDPDQLPGPEDPDYDGNEVYGGCEYECVDGEPVVQGSGECTGQPGGSSVPTGQCPPPPDGICDDPAMDEETFYLACDEVITGDTTDDEDVPCGNIIFECVGGEWTSAGEVCGNSNCEPFDVTPLNYGQPCTDDNEFEEFPVPCFGADPSGGGGPPAAGGCRVWACAWLSNGAGWARIDNTTFVCNSMTCRCLSPPGAGMFGQLEFTQCTPIG